MKRDSIIFDFIQEEKNRQLSGLELIASENFVSPQVMEAQGSVLTNKYAEGYPSKRYYGGCEVIDKIERLAINRAKKLFGAEYVNVQPHSGSQANASVYLACLNAGDLIMGFDLSHGGHLTHGSPVNFSGINYQGCSYGVKKENGLIDYEKMEQIARDKKPQLIICGASAYSRDIDYAKFRSVADEIGAILMADISHPAGLVARGILNNPLPHCHIVTTTTHKTLRGPRGGLIMMEKDFENPFGKKTPRGEIKMMSKLLDMAVFPGMQGGPLEHVIAAKAVALSEALSEEYRQYALQIVKNTQGLANEMKQYGFEIVSGGSDNHCFLIDLRNKNITGKEAENALGRAEITCNKNMVPFDDKSPFTTSGIRLGTAALTTRGLKEEDMKKVAEFIHRVLGDIKSEKIITAVKDEVNLFVKNRPLFA